ncbi:pyrroline-5-carboxylate reductase [Gloeocapsopsis sp. IPPAS B-1203]|uniref:pyrroline-5-carboxylate reductase n=1 Tax=Gloeocapsopsis sp. IPPAS B-1203 TaxID=2049454 RepID=UPI000C1A6A1F|nr:pyrroline-5-carboxylate reductase [Gloeocapsopsis sp. IPPAS B-1203]PIG93222.1 pyrroline-5-carboxylate reductase [Gloeocapsopsis sp. IPPAS B-1203]
MSVKFGIIGGGVMGEALLSRLVSQKIYQPTEIIVGEKSPARRDYLANQYGVSVTDDNYVVTQASVLLLAIKPQVFTAVAAELVSPLTKSTPLVISILAGVSLSQLEKAFPQVPIIRAMPNTPATVGAGMTAISLGAQAGDRDKQIAQQLFTAVGEVVEVPETLMDAVTGLSGSGPAYVALLIEALSDGGVAAGLPRAIATQLALQTVRGTVQLLQETQMHPAELKDRVTSPGGTTIAGVTELERAGFRAGLIAAVKAAAVRSQELGTRD